MPFNFSQYRCNSLYGVLLSFADSPRMTAIHLALAVSLQADKTGDLAGGCYSHSMYSTQKFTFSLKVLPV